MKLFLKMKSPICIHFLSHGNIYLVTKFYQLFYVSISQIRSHDYYSDLGCQCLSHSPPLGGTQGVTLPKHTEDGSYAFLLKALQWLFLPCRIRSKHPQMLPKALLT